MQSYEQQVAQGAPKEVDIRAPSIPGREELFVRTFSLGEIEHLELPFGEKPFEDQVLQDRAR
jgi:hypothetical protein